MTNLVIKGKIVRISNNKENKKLICGISFVDVDKNTREKIIELVFEIMREQIRKGVKGE
jgi:c-di-GMP-binding flagellar brake protein YcgR